VEKKGRGSKSEKKGRKGEEDKGKRERRNGKGREMGGISCSCDFSLGKTLR